MMANTQDAVMKLEDQFTAAMLAAGNKRSSVKSYWPHVVDYIRFTRDDTATGFIPQKRK